MSNLEAAFHQTMLDGYHQLAKLGYRATYFLRMVQELGGVQAARQLANQEGSSEGFTRMWEMGRLDLSAEALMLKPEYRDLFTDQERRRARQNLDDLGYRAPWDTEGA
jgi:hypothetical protein